MEKVTLAADQKKDIYIPGNYLYLYSSDGPIEVVLKEGRSNGETHNMERKALLSNKEFQRIRVRNLSGAVNEIELWSGQGEYSPSADRSDVEVINNVLSPIPVEVQNPTAEATIVAANSNVHKPSVTLVDGVAAVQIAAANANRKTLRVSVPSDAAGPVAIGSSGMLVGEGGLMEPGTTDYIDTEGALYARTDNGVGNVTVWVMELSRV